MPYKPSRTLAVAADHFALLAKWAKFRTVSLRYVRSALTQHNDSRDARSFAAMLVEAGLLEPTPGIEDSWDVPEIFVNLFEHLTNQESLLQSSAIIAIVSDLERLTTALTVSLNEYVGRMPSDIAEEMIRNISQTRRLSQEHYLALINRVTQIKTGEDNRSLKDRYSNIKDLYENHLAPLRRLIQVDGSLSFLIDRIVDITNDKGHGEEWVVRLRNYSHHLKTETIRHFREAMDEVFPLYERYRREHATAVMVAKALDIFRRNGPAVWEIQKHMPISRWSSARLFAESDVERYLAAFLDFNPSAGREVLVTSATDGPAPPADGLKSRNAAR